MACCDMSCVLLLKWLIAKMILIPVGLYHTFTFVLPKILIDLFTLGPSEVFRKSKRNKPPPCLEDPTLGSHCFAYLKNVRLHYVTNGSEDKPLMLLLHGFPEFWYSWRHQLREFKDEYRVVALDMRGYGDSDKPAGIFNYRVQHLISDFEQLITHLGYKKCVLVGHDWGAVLAWLFARIYPDRLERLIILNCPNTEGFQKGIQMGGFTELIKQLRKSWYIFFFQIPWLPEFVFNLRDMKDLEYVFTSDKLGVSNKSAMSKEDVEAYKFNFSRNGFTAPINYYRAEVGNTDAYTTNPVTVPTLIIWGEEDAFLQSSLAEASKVVCTGGVELHYIKNSSHWVQMDSPAIVNKLMWNFLKDETGPKKSD